MFNKFLSTLMAAVLLGGASFAASADNVIYQSANFVDESNAFGNYLVDASNFVGAQFTLTAATDVSAIGGNFTQYSDGSIFGAIVNASNWGNIDTGSLAHVVFSATGGDQLVSLGNPLHLAAGTYDVVFGSGKFGTTGYSGLVDTQDAADTSTMFQSADAGQTVSALSGTPIRVMVAAVPEPETYAMLLMGLGIMGFVAVRRKIS